MTVCPALFIPISARDGDNVVTRSPKTPWYKGPALLEHLEEVDVDENRERLPARFPVQYVLRPNLDFRGYAGQIASGTFHQGDEVIALPARRRSRITRIVTYDGDLETAVAPQSVTLCLADEIDISRGDLIVRSGDPERFQKTYWSDVPGCYFTGDGARKDADGYFWLMGRVDDVINVSGHRLGTMEVESALVAHPKVAEAAVVGRPDELKGQAISAFVSLESGNYPSEQLKDELRKWVSKEIGSLARPDDIRFTEALPKTRSGKIMRRLLRELATHGEIKGDITTLEDFTVIAKLREAEEG